VNTWTHIVVGAGAAGCTLAARLSEEPNHRVLLIEAGKRSFDPLIRVPMATGMLLRGERNTRQYVTEPIPGFNDRRTQMPRGIVLGGSTAINGMVYIRGLASDFDTWAESGLSQWSYEKVLPFFLKSECFLGPGGISDFHSNEGELSVSRPTSPVSILANKFVESGIAAGYPACDDFNAPEPEGFGFYHFTINRGRRVTAADAFLTPARKRRNLEIMTRCEVSRLVFEGNRVNGVVLSTASGEKTIRCEGELVLCAGTMESPAILLRSGIGPAKDLHALGVPVVADSPEVGHNFHDHLLVRVKHRARTNTTLYGLTRGDRAATAFLQAYLLGRGPMTVFPLEAGFMARTAESNRPDLQGNFIPALSSSAFRLNPFRKADAGDQAGFFASVSLMRPKSRGTLKLASKHLGMLPVVQPNYLSEPSDIERLIDGVEILRDVFSQKPFAKHSAGEIEPGSNVTTRAQIANFIRNTADTVHHAVGTCRMGVDGSSVVDENLRVRGVKDLRVADASIFPSIPSMNTAASAIMVGERAADFLANPNGS
jgi:choline dehydrogenase